MKLVPLLVVVALAAAPVAAHAQDVVKDQPFQGGPLSGIVMGPLVRVGNGNHVVGLKPSAPNAAPVPAKFVTAVEGLLRAYDAKDEAALRNFLTADASGEVCPRGMGGPCNPMPPLLTQHFAEHCDHNTPYFMGNNQVRIEWLYRGELWYISFLDFGEGKISHIRTLVAEVPPMLKAPTITKADKKNG